MALSIAKLVSLATGREIKTEDISEFGMNQTWQEAELTDTGAVFTDGTPKYRTAGVIYTNDTGGPIEVSIIFEAVDGVRGSLSITGGLVSKNSSYSTGTPVDFQTVRATVPEGNTYSLSLEIGSITVWQELRK